MGHHFSSELVKEHPALNLSDLYVFRSEQSERTVFVMCTDHSSKIDQKDLLDPAGLYNFHISFDRTLQNGFTVTFCRENGRCRVGHVDTPVPKLGEKGVEWGQAELHGVSELANGIKVWIGLARDPFAGNAIGLREFKKAAAEGRYDPAAFDNRQDFFEDHLTTAIVFELPNTMLGDRIHYHATTQWLDHGHWHRVNRIGHVLVPHLYLEENLRANHDSGDAHSDTERRSAVVDLIGRYARLAGYQQDPAAYAAAMADRFLPDIVPYRIGSDAEYGIDGPNGRAIDDPAMDVALYWLVGGPLAAGVAPRGRSMSSFPYLVPPKASRSPYDQVRK